MNKDIEHLLSYCENKSTLTPQQLVDTSYKLLQILEKDVPYKFIKERKLLKTNLNEYCYAPWAFLKKFCLEDMNPAIFPNIDRFFRDSVHSGDYNRFMDPYYKKLKSAFEELAEAFSN